MKSLEGTAGYQGTLTFLTDPICSWCWGTLPEIEKTRAVLGDRLKFVLRCAGLQVGSMRPLTQPHVAELMLLWRSVAETTGQRFTYALPDNDAFIYHSELACRAIQIARQIAGAEPWQAFHRIQQAFYVDSSDIGDLCELHRLTASDLSYADFEEMITDPQIVATTREEFSWCQALGTQALPTLLLDTGQGPKLVCGGYVSAEYLIPELTSRLKTH